MSRRAVAGHIVICAESAIKSPCKYFAGAFYCSFIFFRMAWTLPPKARKWQSVCAANSAACCIHDAVRFFEALNGGALRPDCDLALKPVSGYAARVFGARDEENPPPAKRRPFTRLFRSSPTAEYSFRRHTGAQYNDILRGTVIAPAQCEAKAAAGDRFICAEPKVSCGAGCGICELRIKKTRRKQPAVRRPCRGQRLATSPNAPCSPLPKSAKTGYSQNLTSFPPIKFHDTLPRALFIDNAFGEPKNSRMKFEKIDPKSVAENSAKLIGSDWMLVCAGDRGGFNMMTASWGAFGFMWNMPAFFVFVRPSRHTYGFMESRDSFTVNILPESRRDVLKICGSRSGRDCDKAAAAGLTPEFTERGGVYFAEARLVFECRKAYSQMMEAGSFADKSLVEKWYAASDFHKMYVGVVEGAFAAK